MKDIKVIVAKNIAELRQSRGMTQLELAEKLNYSDKAISKWERGDSCPDVSVLLEIADIFGVSLDFLVREERTSAEIKASKKLKERYSRGAITCMAILLVWLVALFIYVVISLVLELSADWLCFVYAVPISFVVWLVLNSVWFNRRSNYFIISALMWSGLCAIYLTLLPLALPANNKLWEIFLLGIPGQLMILLWSKIKNKRNQ